MPEDYTAQRGGPRRGPRSGFRRRFPLRRFPRFFFSPIYYNAPPRCDHIDRYGRCCDYYGNCYYDYSGGAYQDAEAGGDPAAAWPPSEIRERTEYPGTGGDYYDQY